MKNSREDIDLSTAGINPLVFNDDAKRIIETRIKDRVFIEHLLTELIKEDFDKVSEMMHFTRTKLNEVILKEQDSPIMKGFNEHLEQVGIAV